MSPRGQAESVIGISGLHRCSGFEAKLHRVPKRPSPCTHGKGNAESVLSIETAGARVVNMGPYGTDEKMDLESHP